MPGGGGGGETTVYQSGLPQWAEPYHTRLMDRAESESLREYVPYEYQRTAETAPETWMARDMVMGMQGIPGLGEAYDATKSAADSARNLQNFQVGEYNPYQGSQYQYGNAAYFTPDAAGAYMSPYMQNVVDAQKQYAQLDFDRAQSGRDAAAVQAGAFGGSRGAVVNSLAQEDLARRMGEIQATGLQQSYQDAQSMFDRDRQAIMRRDAERAAEQARIDALRADQTRTAGDLAYRRESLLGDIGLRATGMEGDLGQNLYRLGAAERQAVLEDAQLREQIGADVEGTQQAYLDRMYQDYLRQLNYPMEQLTRYSDIIQGTPFGRGDVTQTTTGSSNPYLDAIGSGISAIGLYQGLG
jgi:hypothetical protein